MWKQSWNVWSILSDKVFFSEIILNKTGMEQHAMCKVCQEKEGFLHLFLYCKELEEFLKKCKGLVKNLTVEWDETEWGWNRVGMFGWENKCQNKAFINLCVMLMKSAIWERRIVAKKKKKETKSRQIAGCPSDITQQRQSRRFSQQHVASETQASEISVKTRRNHVGRNKIFGLLNERK